MDLPAYYDEYMKRRPASPQGYIHMSKENFLKMVNKAESESDFELLIDAYANYLGHRNFMPQTYVDAMMEKAAKHGAHHTMYTVF